MSTNQGHTFTCQPVLLLRVRLRLSALIASLCLGYAATGFADLYQWTDAQGTLHLGNDASEAPADSRTELRVSPANTPKAGREPAAALISPRRQYAARSQGAFAQQLALDLGLIRQRDEDALGPLSGAGIAPAGYWHVTEPPTAEGIEEVVAAARRAAASGRLALSAEGAEAVVRQAAAPYFPAVTPAAEQKPAGRHVIHQDPPLVIIEQPPAQREVSHEPVYVSEPSPYVWAPTESQLRAVPRLSPTPPSSLSPPGTGPTHLPVGTSHLPFGASHLPFGTTHLGGPSGQDSPR
jgi:hypothetical protein